MQSVRVPLNCLQVIFIAVLISLRLPLTWEMVYFTYILSSLYLALIKIVAKTGTFVIICIIVFFNEFMEKVQLISNILYKPE